MIQLSSKKKKTNTFLFFILQPPKLKFAWFTPLFNLVFQQNYASWPVQLMHWNVSEKCNKISNGQSLQNKTKQNKKTNKQKPKHTHKKLHSSQEAQQFNSSLKQP